MEASISTPIESNRKKRRKIETETPRTGCQPRWRTETEQRSYSTKLIEALRRVRQNPSTSSSAVSGVREVRQIADRVLAVSAKGRTRWSRAILANRMIRLNRFKKVKKVRNKTGDSRLRKVPVVQRKRKLPAVEKKVKVLSRLLPGCRGIPVSSVLEEASDYIAALEMQVRAMTALTRFLTSSSYSDQTARLEFERS